MQVTESLQPACLKVVTLPNEMQVNTHKWSVCPTLRNVNTHAAKNEQGQNNQKHIRVIIRLVMKPNTAVLGLYDT
jgi:hypothetical protein